MASTTTVDFVGLIVVWKRITTILSIALDHARSKSLFYRVEIAYAAEDGWEGTNRAFLLDLADTINIIANPKLKPQIHKPVKAISSIEISNTFDFDYSSFSTVVIEGCISPIVASRGDYHRQTATPVAIAVLKIRNNPSAINADTGNRPRRALPGAPAPSPSGSLLLQLVESKEAGAKNKGACLSFKILSPDGSVVFEPRRKFAAWMTVVIGWDANDRVWVKSGDVGVRMWAREGATWREHYWQADGPAAPSPDRTIWDAETKANMPVIGGPLPESINR